MRVLIDRLTGQDLAGDVDDDRLRELYGVPRLPWLRANMVSTVDGAATGPDGRSGSINNPVDKRVFHLLRASADALLVGAGTARAEGYHAAAVPTVLVSRSGGVPERLRAAPPGMVLMITCASAPALAETTELLGSDNVLVLGEETVDLAAVRPALAERGLQNVLCEGGPQLLAGLLAVGQVDELCMTLVPQLVVGSHPRIAAGPDAERSLRLGVLLEEGGTLLGRWLT